VSATLDQLRRYLGGLTVHLRNFGATVAEPALDRYDSGEVGFEFEAHLPGPDSPKPALLRIGEVWAPSGDRFERREYLYDLIEYPLNRRRALHGHDPEAFARRFGVLVHEHCEEILDRPACDHFFGYPVANGYEALARLLATWGQPGALGCAELRCMG